MRMNANNHCLDVTSIWVQLGFRSSQRCFASATCATRLSENTSLSFCQNTATWHQNTIWNFIWNPISQVIMEKSMLNESMNAMNMKTLEPTCGYIVIGMVCIVCLIAFFAACSGTMWNGPAFDNKSKYLNKLRISSDFSIDRVQTAANFRKLLFTNYPI